MKSRPTPPQALSLFADEDVAVSGQARPTERRPARTKPAAEKAASPSRQQPKLTGLSLRGRPPKRDKATNTERATGSRKRRMAAGGRRLELMLNAEENRLLDLLAEQRGMSRADVVKQMILRAGKLLPKAGGTASRKKRG